MAVQQPTVKLNDGNAIPQLGFGVWQVPAEDTAKAVGEAIGIGYRHIDTAQGYENEKGVGEAVERAELPREELFITTKLRNGKQGYDSTLSAFDASMRKLGLEVLDLFLIHWPVPEAKLYSETWKAFVRLQGEGRVKSIGVSNFNPDHLERIIGDTGVVPAVNQIELHPGWQQRKLRGVLGEQNIAVESWSPLGQGNFVTHPVIEAIASKHGRTPAQAIIRWHLDEGLIVFPKSVTPSRIAENFDVFDFTLDEDDKRKIAALDNPNGKIGPEPAVMNVQF